MIIEMKNKKCLRRLMMVLGIGVSSWFWYRESPKIKEIDHPKGIVCIDGDTFILNQETIRLLAVNTPEIDHALHSRESEPYGQEAKEMTCSLLKQASVILLQPEMGNTKDKYGRSLYYVKVDQIWLQEALLRQGLAKVQYVNHQTISPSRYHQLLEAQQEAKNNHLNLWK